MLLTLYYIYILLLCVVSIPVIVLCIEVFSSLIKPGNELPKNIRSGRVGVLVPAHNEAIGIEATLQCILPQLRPDDRCLVVADNCNDETANVARSCGCEVIERFDSNLKGKGYALDFGIKYFKNIPPDIIVIIDADCFIVEDFIDKIGLAVESTNRPIQALDLMHVKDLTSPVKRISEFAWTLKNHIRPLGLHNMSLPCQLMGTGMAFPWSLLSSVNIATGHIVEDMRLGIDFAIKGFPPIFFPDTKIYSFFPTTQHGIDQQRKRWEHGHISTIISEVPRLLWCSIRKRNLALFFIGLDILIPPVALLAAISLLHTGISGLIYYFTTFPVALIVSMSVLSVFFVSIGVAWFRHGRSIISFRDLMYAVFYLAKKIPVYMQFLYARQTSWVRAKRDGE